MGRSYDQNRRSGLYAPQHQRGAIVLGGGGGSAHSIPAGGSTGQLLTKNSNADYDTSWLTSPAFAPVSSRFAVTGTESTTAVGTMDVTFPSVVNDDVGCNDAVNHKAFALPIGLYLIELELEIFQNPAAQFLVYLYDGSGAVRGGWRTVCILANNRYSLSFSVVVKITAATTLTCAIETNGTAMQVLPAANFNNISTSGSTFNVLRVK